MRSFLKCTFFGLALAAVAAPFASQAQAGYGCRPKPPCRYYNYNYPPSYPPPRPVVVVQQPVVVQGAPAGQPVQQVGFPQGQPQQGFPQNGQAQQGFPQNGQPQGGFQQGNGQQTGINLQLADIRLVEPGIPERNLGPRFRVVVRNASQFAVTQPIDLMLAGGTSRKFEPVLPHIVEQIQSMSPGQTIAVEMRLPLEAMAMKYAGEEKPAPFNTMFVMMAGQQDLLGNATLKPLAIVPRIGIQMVDLVVHQPADNKVPSGAVLMLGGEGFGIDGGSVVLQLGSLKLHGEVVNWSPMGVQVKLPELALAAPTAGELIVARADGDVAKALKLEVHPAQANGQAGAAQGLPAQAGIPQQGGPQQGIPMGGQQFAQGGEPMTGVPSAPQPSGADLLRRPPEFPMGQ